MKKKALKKEFRVEVRKSLNRFLSIFFIVAMGVAFFSGIQASAPDMRATGDYYFDSTKLMDIKVLGTLGLSEDDLEAVRAVEGVADAKGVYMEDVYCGEEVQQVLHVESIPEDMNLLTPRDGAVPAKAGECFLDASYAEAHGYHVGDTLQVTVSSSDDTQLKRTKFQIAGIGYSSSYIAFERGSTTLGNGAVSGFLYLVPEDFDSEVYSTIYVRVDGAQDEMAYTDGYDTLVADVQDRIEAIENVRCQVRYDAVMEEAKGKLDDARQQVEDGKQQVAEAQSELESGRNEAESELAQAQSELTEGESELEKGKETLEDSRKELADGEAELSDGEAEIAENEQKLQDGEAELASGEERLQSGEESYRTGLTAYQKESEAAAKKFKQGEEQIRDGETQLKEGWAEYEKQSEALKAGSEQLAAAETRLEESQEQYEDGAAQLAAAKKQYEDGMTQLESGEAQYESGAQQLAQGWKEYEAGAAQLTEAKKEYESGASQLAAAEEQYVSGMTQVKEGRTSIKEGKKQIAATKKTLARQEEQLSGQEEQLAGSEEELTQAEKAWSDSDAALTPAREAYASAEQSVQARKTSYDTAVQMLESLQADADQRQREAAALRQSYEDQKTQAKDLRAQEQAAEQERSTAEAKAQELRARIGEKQSALTAKQSELAQAQASYEQLQKETGVTEEELQNAAASVEARRNEADALQAEITSLESEANAQEQAAAEAKNRAQTAASQASTIENALSQAEAAAKAAEQTAAQAQEKAETQADAVQKAKNQYETANTSLEVQKQELDAKEEELSRQKQTLEANRQALDESKRQLEAAQSALAKGKEELAAKEQELTDREQELDATEQQLAAVRTELDKRQKELAKGKQELDANEQALKEAKKTLEAKEKELQQAKTKLTKTRATLEAAGKQLKEKAAELSKAKTQLSEGWRELNQKKKELESGEKQLANAKTQLEANEEKLKSAKEEIAKGKQQLADAKVQLDTARAQLDTGWAQLNASRKQLSDGWQQLSDAKTQLEEAREKLADGRKQIADGEKELAENEQKIADGWKDYEEGKKEAQEKIADGEQKIADAKKELADAEAEISDAEQKLSEIKYPSWYVYDRSELPDNAGFGENAERLTNIAQVFPLLFFLVAALISLTTMTRMVEEERTQIGTMKALGYSKKDIAGKYLKYAFLATVGGSIVGVLAGEKILPWIIVDAYGIMYQYLPKILIPYEWKFGGLAAGAALICTMAATCSACIRELQAVPAQLMRPPAPKEGKRVFLEYLPFLWRRLGFTWKSTIRNLMRYKKRFLMTVIGIGGCMGLLLVGFGLRDSIMDVALLQFEQLQLYDEMVILDTDVKETEQEAVWTAVQENDSVQAEKRFYMQKIQTKGAKAAKKEWIVYLYVPEDTQDLDEFFCFRNRENREETYTLSDDGAIITEKIAKEFGVSAGDTIILKTSEKDIEIPVAAVCENYLSHYIYLTPALYRTVFEEEPEYNSIFVKTENGLTEAETLGEQLLKNDAVLNVTYTKSLEDQLDHMLGALDIVIVVLIVSAGMLAFVVLYNLNNININERRRELATIKVLGFYDGEVAAYVYRENILLTVIGAIAGIFIGKFLHAFIITTVEVDACMFGRSLKLASYIYGTLFTFGFSILVNMVMYFKLKKIDMVESLKSVE